MSEPELTALRQAAASSRAMADHLARLKEALASFLPVDADRATGSDAEIERFHAFLRMFEQLYDVTTRRLFRGLLLMLREDYRAVAFKQVLRRLERLDRLSDGDRWVELGETRNILVHDYAATPAAFADHMNRAWNDLDDLLRIHSETLAHLQAEGLGR